VRISEHYDIAHFSTGDLFRELARLETTAGLRAKEYMDAGELVPDETVMAVVCEALEPGGPLGDGFVLDGFPRTRAQAESFETILDGHALDLVLNLDVPLEIVLDRISGRRVCVGCQRVYHVAMPPETPWVCDTCGEIVEQRDDDTEEAIDRRLQLYEEQTVPIIDYYRERGMLAQVSGVGEGDDVFKRLVKVVDARRCA
jgi:adenylate kinase